jgi:hypothetical protein
MKSTLALGIIALGFLLLVASGVFSTLFPPTNSWTTDKAQRMSEVKAQINNVGAQLYKAQQSTHGQDPAPIKTQYDTLLKEFEQLNTDFETATARPLFISTVLKWSGISFAILGIIFWYAVKQTSG